MLNDPALSAQANKDQLPLTVDFGPVLGGMIARTGWDTEPGSGNVVAEIKGGGYHFGNHQHADAGSLQLYYRGLQLGDIGVYTFYGTPLKRYALTGLAEGCWHINDKKGKVIHTGRVKKGENVLSLPLYGGTYLVEPID